MRRLRILGAGALALPIVIMGMTSYGQEGQPGPHATQPSQAPVDLVFSTPADWKKRPGERYAGDFDLPAATGETDQPRLNYMYYSKMAFKDWAIRLCNRFTLPDGRPFPVDELKFASFEANGVRVDTVELYGTFTPKDPEGPPRPGYRFIGAYFSAPGGAWTVFCSGTEKGIAHNRPAIEAWFKSVRVQHHLAPFPDFRDPPPSTWTDPVFKLSQNYPQQPPPAEAFPWLKIDFRTHWKEYLMAVLEYGYEGNLDVDWRVQDNKTRTWYHAPWLHWGRNGREFVRGLTNERPSLKGELGPGQTTPVQNWAVGMYNPPGGYVIGQVWKDPYSPNPAVARFPEGTISFKLLFTEATPEMVPYLEGSPSWQASIYREIVNPTNPRLPRVIRTMRLLQIDVAVRDSRADTTTGWVFGTFTYNSAVQNASPWRRVTPIGLMWGNDPTKKPPAALEESVINPDPAMPAQHLGWGGRLNGPVDNPLSSCLSCHATSQWPTLDPLVPPNNVPQGSADWMRWFRNVKAGDPFTQGAESLDYSLQLAAGIQNFYEWKAIVLNRGGAYATPPPPAVPGVKLMDMGHEVMPDRPIYPVDRGGGTDGR